MTPLRDPVAVQVVCRRHDRVMAVVRVPVKGSPYVITGYRSAGYMTEIGRMGVAQSSDRHLLDDVTDESVPIGCKDGPHMVSVFVDDLRQRTTRFRAKGALEKLVIS